MKDTGISEEIARQYCEAQINASSSFADCVDILGPQMAVYTNFCVRDYMVSVFVSCMYARFCGSHYFLIIKRNL